MKEIQLGNDDLSRTQRDTLRKAVKIAQQSQGGCRQSHAAIVVKGGRILSIGINKLRNDPAMFSIWNDDDYAISDISVHAEIDAISKVKKKSLEGSTVYVARVAPSGVTALSRPCPACYQALLVSGVKKVVYS